MPMQAALLALALGAAPAPPARYMQWNARAHVVHLTLLAGLGSANNGFNFDGYGCGQMLVRVPLGWRVVVDCENCGTMRHSCAVVHGPLETEPAFAGAATPQPVMGLSPGAKATFSFAAGRTGTYRIACLVPGHEQARMYDVLDVVHGTPSITAR